MITILLAFIVGMFVGVKKQQYEINKVMKESE